MKRLNTQTLWYAIAEARRAALKRQLDFESTAYAALKDLADKLEAEALEIERMDSLPLDSEELPF